MTMAPKHDIPETKNKSICLERCSPQGSPFIKKKMGQSQYEVLKTGDRSSFPFFLIDSIKLNN